MLSALLGDANSLTPVVGVCLACMSHPSVPPNYRQNVSGLSEGLSEHLCNKWRLTDDDIVRATVRKLMQPSFEASFDARAARTCAAILFLDLSHAVSLLCVV